MPDGLPPWLNMYQLAAWVEYRDLSVVAVCGNASGLGGQHAYGTQRHVGHLVDLERALQEGQLTALGSKVGEPFAPIPAVEWTRFARHDVGQLHPYSRIQVQRDDVLRVFALPTVGRIASTPVAAAQGECVTWLQSQFADDPNAKRTKAEFQAAAIKHFGGRLSLNAFLRAWAGVAPAAGRSKPGRKS